MTRILFGKPTRVFFIPNEGTSGTLGTSGTSGTSGT
jgi:hypothetical protein